MILSIHAAALAAAACLSPVATNSPAIAISSLAAVQITVGGYRAADLEDAGVQAAVAFAAEQLGVELGEIQSAERQVVAGTNYRLVFTSADGTRYRAIVYRPLRGDMQLTSSEEMADE
jgi:hypothetical protein